MFRSILAGLAVAGLVSGTALAAGPIVVASFADLAARGYTVAATATMPDPTPPKPGDQPQLDLVITMQNGTSVAVCYMSVYGWLAMSDDNVLRPDGCKARDLSSGGGQAAASPSK